MNKNDAILLQSSIPEGILLIDKESDATSFSLVRQLRRILNVKKIGHAGTLDPFATGLMVMLIGRNYTRLSDTFLLQDKEYEALVKLGVTTDTYDREGQTVATSDNIPSLHEVESALTLFQGTIEQTPPMFSAKKVGGKKLYDLARKGISIERKSVPVTLTTTLLNYNYPYLSIHVRCSKGTYIRSLAYDLGIHLTCGAHLQELRRLRSGPFHLKDALPLTNNPPPETLISHLMGQT